MYSSILIGLTTGGIFLLGFLLFFHPLKSNIHANKYLGFFVITLGFAMLEIFLKNLNQPLHPAILEIIGLIRFLSAPALYLSIAYYTSLSRTISIKNLGHLIPFFCFLLFSMPLMLTGKNIPLSKPVSHIVFPIIIYALPVQTLVYWILSYKKLNTHQQNLKQIASTTESTDLSWLKNFLWVLAAIVLIWFNLLIFNIQPLFKFTPLLYLVSVYFLAYFSLNQKEIYDFEKQERRELNEVIAAQDNQKLDKKQRFSESRIQLLKSKLELLMENDKVYLENEISLPLLAGRMELSSHEMSYLINEYYGESFFSFINRYRVEEAKKLLLTENFEKHTILGIAFQSGFNSKTTFNTTFKKITGQSPREYIQTMRK